MARARPTLLLTGFMGAGKSTVGREVAARAQVPFLDLDDAIEARVGREVRAIFAEDGEPAFRALEAEELTRALSDSTVRVVALGGGALLDTTRRRAVLDRARVVTLTARPETLATRCSLPGRPLLDASPDRLGAIRTLLTARADAYAESHARVPTDDRPIAAIAADVLEAWDRPAIAVPLGTRSYTVQLAAAEPLVAASAIASLSPSAVFVVTDENVARLWGASLEAALADRKIPSRATVILTPGEEHKRLAAVEQALTAMVEAGADRDAVVIGHGGGVVTDIAGFTAATLLRGVRWVALPSTLLAMVDASVGGKTGVDLGPAKNAVGAFHQPSAVVIDAALVSTETERAYRGGLAEVVKSACIGDAALLDLLEADPDRVLARDPEIVEEIVHRSVAVKASIVSRDERESGDRLLLNFGHTLGHALEAAGGFTQFTHGEAVSLGMAAMLRAGVSLGVTDAAVSARVIALLDRLGLPTALDPAVLTPALDLLGLDKKRRAGAIRVILLRTAGTPEVRPMTVAELRATLAG